MTLTLQDILPILKGVKRMSEGWIALCPAHDDHNPSLSISQGEKGPVLFCHAGCSFEQIKVAVGLDRKNGNGSRMMLATYDYFDEQNNLLYQEVRYSPKDFRQRKPDGKGGWDWKLNGVRRVPYRLPELLAADLLMPVFIVEGEKDADRLLSL